jgi:hypothetical protein
VRLVATLEEHACALEVMWEAFATTPERRAAQSERLGELFWAGLDHGATATLLAPVADRPVAAGRATFCDRGALLFGGSTLPEAHRRGAHRALVRARWDEAVRRGTSALVTQAGPGSEPILRRLGFEEVCRLRRPEDPT